MPETNFVYQLSTSLLTTLGQRLVEEDRCNVPEISSTKERVSYSECCEELINVYPEDLNSNLFNEFLQFHACIRHKLSATKSGNT